MGLGKFASEKVRPARTPAGPPPSSLLPGRHPIPRCRPDHPRLPHRTQDDDAPGTSRAPGGPPGANPTAGITKDPWAPPDGWMDAPEQGSLVCDVFVPSKVPLSDRWFARVPPERRYGPAEALAAARVTAGGRPVELVVDLTNSSRYYDPRAFESAGASYSKVACVGKDAPPDPVAVTQFVYVVGKFLAERAQRGSNGVILVHCTHGYNRTGAMLVHHMQRARSWPKLNEHVAEFARARPPCGIYKPEYIRELFDEYLERRFRTTIDPPLPDFKRGEAKTDAPPLDDANVPADDLFGSLNPDYVATRAASRAPRPGGARGFAGFGDGSNSRATTAGGNADGSPMHHDDVLGEEVFEGQAREIRTVVLWLCGQEGNRFPGSQPVSLARDNMAQLSRQEYHVTWKADGTRYMLLLMRDGVYLIDRKFAVRRVTMRFPAPLKTHGVATHNATLLDGEMVVDDVGGGKQRRRFLAYDMMALHGERLVDRPFVERVAAVAKHVVEPRNVFLADAGRSGAYDFTKEPFSVRPKDFSPLPGTERFVRDFIPKLTHECDGLIFQPSHARYENGTMASLLKWKFTHLNSVDFLLKLRWRPGSRPAPALYVGGEGGDVVEVHEPSGAFVAGGDDAETTADGRSASDLDGKIVECTWDASADTGDGAKGAWRFLRVRTDKDTPNFITVYRHTLQSILDDITDEEIIALVARTTDERRRARATAGGP